MKRSTKQILLGLVISTQLVIGFQNCSQAQFTQADQASESVGLGEEQGSSSPKYVDKVLNFQVTSSQNSKIDILFVIDNSGSMAAEQAKLAQVFSGFISKISNLDWRVGVTTTDNSSANGAKGSLLPYTSGAFFIEANTPNANSLFISRIQTGTNGSGTETGLTSISNFLVKAATAGSNESSFLRPNAIFTTIVVTDSDQSQSGTRAATTTSGTVLNVSSKSTITTSGSRTSESGTLGNAVVPSEFVAEVRAALPEKEYIHHSSIALPGDVACKSQSEMYGTTYFDVTNLTGGINASLCDVDYADQFELMAQSIINRVSEKTLDCAPADVNQDGHADVKIKDPSGGIISQYSISGNKVIFPSELDIIGAYQILYKCAE